MQSIEGIEDVLKTITERGFETDAYQPTKDIWIGFAASKSYRRYFKIENADTVDPAAAPNQKSWDFFQEFPPSGVIFHELHRPP